MRGVRTGAVAALAVTLAAAAGCHTMAPGPAPVVARSGPACQDVTFPIYFAEGSDQLTPTAAQVIALQAGVVRGCRIGYVSVLGLTDAQGGSTKNLDLSRRRAATVAKALADQGLPAPKFEVSGQGESGALTDKGHPVPLRRKTEVVIHPLPPA